MSAGPFCIIIGPSHGQGGGPGGHGPLLRGLAVPSTCMLALPSTCGPPGLRCHRSQGRHTHHAAINDIVKRSLTSVARCALSLGTNWHLPIG